MLVIHIDDMQLGLEEVQYRLHRTDGYRKVHVFKIRKQHDVFGRSRLRIRRYDDHRHDPPLYDIQASVFPPISISPSRVEPVVPITMNWMSLFRT